ncbi:MAG: LamG-like jellyroll fold domain-containing protein [Planctomycetota bacterium]|jgi:predicted outer membrane repeat protein
METRKMIVGMIVAVLVLLSQQAWATQYYVSPDGNDNLSGTTWATAFETIGKGISTASNNDIIDINEGTYYEAIDYGGKAIEVRSTDANDWGVVAATIIDANNASSDAVTFDTGEDANSVLRGLTVTGATVGVYADSVGPVISRCILHGNRTGVKYTKNSTGTLIVNNKIYDCNGYGVFGHKGDATIKSNWIYDSDKGIKLSSGASADIYNNTIVNNISYGIDKGGGQGVATISNCIIWDCNDDLEGCSATYSYISDCEDVGDANTTHNSCDDPLFLAWVPERNLVSRWKMDDNAANRYVAASYSTPTELVTNGMFTSSSGWTFGGNWSYDSANEEADHSGMGAWALSQNISVTAGKRYMVTYTVKNRTFGGVGFILGGETGTVRSANGTYAEVVTAINTDGLEFWAVTSYTGSIDDVFCFCLDDLPNGTFYDDTGDPNTNAHDTTGQIDGALTFDGQDDYVTIDSPDGLDNLPLDDMTVCGWIYDEYSTGTTWGTIMGCYADNNGWSFRTFSDANGDRSLHFQAPHSAGDYSKWATSWSSDGTITSNTWHHVAAVWDASTKTAKLYIDGSEPTYQDIIVGVGAYNSDASRNKEIGRIPHVGGGQYFDGLLDEVLIYKSALSSDEISQLYQYGLAGDNDYHLQPDSPCIEAGDPCYVPEANETDIDNKARIHGLTVDMSAVESLARWYVDDDRGSNGSGDSWDTAFKYLQDALASDNLKAGDEIWVAGGIYKPTTSTTNRSASFQLKAGVTIKGGYAGLSESGPDRDIRDIHAYETILSGDIDGGGTPSGNSYHVVKVAWGLEGVVIDGFTITGGNADGSWPDDEGGGIHCEGSDPIIANCLIADNDSSAMGGGIWYNTKNGAINNCAIVDNSSGGTGGGLQLEGLWPIVTGCVFVGNEAEDGGGVYDGTLYGSTITNCTFSGNRADDDGGALASSYISTPQLTNCILWGDDAVGSGDEISGSATVSYSCVEGGWSGSNNIDDDPLFGNSSLPAGYDGIYGTWDDGLQLEGTSSPCYGTGEGGTDMGAYQFTHALPYPYYEVWTTWGTCQGCEDALRWGEEQAPLYVKATFKGLAGCGGSCEDLQSTTWILRGHSECWWGVGIKEIDNYDVFWQVRWWLSSSNTTLRMWYWDEDWWWCLGENVRYFNHTPEEGCAIGFVNDASCGDCTCGIGGTGNISWGPYVGWTQYKEQWPEWDSGKQYWDSSHGVPPYNWDWSLYADP